MISYTKFHFPRHHIFGIMALHFFCENGIQCKADRRPRISAANFLQLSFLKNNCYYTSYNGEINQRTIFDSPERIPLKLFTFELKNTKLIEP